MMLPKHKSGFTRRRLPNPKNFTKFSILTLFLCAVIAIRADNDFLLMKDGREIPVKIIQVSDKQIVYTNLDSKSQEKIAALTDVYMIHYEKRGNVFISNEGKRVTGENAKYDKDASIIYLIKGSEIPAFNPQIKNDTVTYAVNKLNNNVIKKFIFREGDTKIVYNSIPCSEIFLIKHPDGTRDIINDIQLYAEKTEVTEVTAKKEQPKKEVVEQKGIFHKVKRGETLSIIAKQYDVKVEDIVKWNKLPKTIKPKSRLKANRQLMIYITPIRE